MFVTPMNQNTIVIAPIQTGCCKAEFDSTYPIHLNGIIRQDEFQQSIANINATFSSRKSLVICIIVSLVCYVVGLALFIAGPISSASSRSFGFPVLLGIGLGIFVIGIMTMAIGMICIQSQRAKKMREAVAVESMKYSTRTPTPCSWRLDATTVLIGGYQRRRTTVIYRILIEFGQPQPAIGGGFHNPAFAAPPPPYSAVENLGFCPRCGIPRANHTDKFCASCGHMHNI